MSKISIDSAIETLIADACKHSDSTDRRIQLRNILSNLQLMNDRMIANMDHTIDHAHAFNETLGDQDEDEGDPEFNDKCSDPNCDCADANVDTDSVKTTQ